jgi:hypothetical protein
MEFKIVGEIAVTDENNREFLQDLKNKQKEHLFEHSNE